LDNDVAGTAAVERICRNGFLLQLVHDNPVVRVAVAQLPDGTKDPADFIDECLESSAAKDFWEQVVDPAIDWTDWYIRRLVGAHNASTSSFADTFESVAEFMAEAMTAQDRTKCAPRVAGLLEKLLTNEEKNDATLRVQLESDLLDLSSRVASARETVERSGTSVLGALSQGYGMTSWDDSSSLLSSNATRENSDGATLPTDGYLDAEWGDKTSFVREEQESGRPQRLRENKEPNALTPHFSGFEFAHQTDQEWLGLSKKKVRELAVLYALSTLVFSYPEYR
jgi:DNA primase